MNRGGVSRVQTVKKRKQRVKQYEGEEKMDRGGKIEGASRVEAENVERMGRVLRKNQCHVQQGVEM